MTAERSRTGRILYAELPEEYRFRDPPTQGEPGDLEAYLHGFGDLLDLVRATLRQLYADSFAEAIDQENSIQPWVIPYMADLVGATLLSPDEDIRKKELAQAVTWTKGKGTLNVVDAIADVLSGAEGIAVEGWRKTLTTPRNWLPPFLHTLPKSPKADFPPVVAGHDALPSGTPDLRLAARAVKTAGPGDLLHRYKKTSRNANGEKETHEVIWKLTTEKGIPCFPGSYEDLVRVTPDLRAPGPSATGVNPARLLVYLAPPFGFFEPGLLELQSPQSLTRDQYQPGDIPGAENLDLDKAVITNDLIIPPDRAIRFKNLLFKGTITVKPGAELHLDRCAVRKAVLETHADPAKDPAPKLVAINCLFEEIFAPTSLVLLDYSTVLKDVKIGRIWASDSIFAGEITAFDCTEDKVCIRYSRVSPTLSDKNCPGIKFHPNTTDKPIFIRVQECAGTNESVVPEFGKPGAGVLDPSTLKSISGGAEDSGEMGAYHHQYHLATVTALTRKIADHLPCGIEPVAIYDPRLAGRLPEGKQQ